MVAEVNDSSLGKKVTILDIVSIITIPLIGFIGYMMITEISQANTSLKTIKDTLITILIEQERNRGKFANIESGITRIKLDVKEVRDVQTNYGERIYKLEGK